MRAAFGGNKNVSIKREIFAVLTKKSGNCFKKTCLINISNKLSINHVDVPPTGRINALDTISRLAITKKYSNFLLENRRHCAAHRHHFVFNKFISKVGDYQRFLFRIL